MPSSSKAKKSCATGVSLLILLSALMIEWSSAHADSASAEPTALASPASTEAAEGAELATEIQVQLARIVPVEMRIDGITLGCKPLAGATLKAVAPGIATLTSRSLMVELQSGDRTTFCSASMNASRRLLTAARDLEADSTVTEADFTSSWIDAFTIAPGALASFPGQGPYLAAAPIRAGQPLYQNSLKHPIAVHSGDLVTVLVKNGPITVRTQLQAQTQAVVGESATLINPASGTPVVVTVTGPRTAELVMQ